ncbi:MAG: CoA-transferase [Candidatus Vecturithrix sp.]|jgi:propionate CoA-transferase|nr:CoA-transferase [Candidatus Vecturithrix sp.]
MKRKVITAEEAVQLIQDGDWLAIQGSGGGVGEPGLLVKTLGERFQREGCPRNLTLCHSTGIGNQKGSGIDYLALPGLVKRDIAGHLGMAPKMGQMILHNELEAYNFPQGVLARMYSAVAAKKPGVITKVGLHTYIDPRLDGGKMNDITTEELVKILEIEGEEWLFFPRFHFDAAFVKGTTADTKGNITSEQEGAFLENLSIAQAAKNSGGIVIAQVKYLAQAGTLNPQHVKIPGIYVDYIVVDEQQTQTCLDVYNPAYCGHVKVPQEHFKPLLLDEKKVIARRAAQEIKEGAVVNLGFGIPSNIVPVAVEEGRIDEFTLTVEQGAIGGMPVGGVIFGVANNPEAIIPMDAQFHFYDGGGLDVAFLGMAQIDAEGNVNSSKVGNNMLAGCGGFIDITQNAKKVVFCGTFTAKGLRCDVGSGGLTITQEGSVHKFVEQVNQITFSGQYARELRQPVLYVTERAVFELTETGVKLLEIAPGIDLERDVLALMEFRPIVPDRLTVMDTRIFT